MFVLQNLGLEYLLLNKQTLQVAVLVDVEEAWYFPEVMQQRTFDRAAMEALCGDDGEEACRPVVVSRGRVEMVGRRGKQMLSQGRHAVSINWMAR